MTDNTDVSAAVEAAQATANLNDVLAGIHSPDSDALN
jgi:hypothetical protein